MVRLITSFTCFALVTQPINGASISETDHALNIIQGVAGIASAPRSTDMVSPEHVLERRKGGGGRGGGGGGGSGSSGRGSSGSSTSGGSTRLGSGSPRSYGGGGYYGGGAAVPFQSGAKTPKGLIAAPLLAGAAVIAIMPGLWLYSVYPYYYHNPYRFWNRTANATNNNARDLISRQEPVGVNQTLPVVCLCQEYSVCGCDENSDQAYINDLVGNGSYLALNKSLITVSEVNGTKSLVLNGSLPNGTTAPGGIDDAAASLSLGKYSGYYAIGLIVLYGVFT
ncbi:hypothetical protein GQ44DRAFT_43074 [Phaeosphaeriaceae sp. PMI808]|nr:hypothetical protein GQ44DRAFT_43074 [Phaeosphaeriaceae sp. PMI808]